MKNINNKSNSNKGFYVALCSSVALLVIIACGVSVFNDSSLDNTSPDIVADGDSLEDSAPANQSDVKSYLLSDNTSTTEAVAEATTSGNNSKSANSTDAKTQDNTIKSETTTQKTKVSNSDPVFSLFDDTKEMSWPVIGQVIMDYSVETAIYDKTLEQYRTNDSVCIAAPVGTDVTASAEGIVQSITNDSVNGNSVVINHGNGWMSTYSQLQDNILVTEGEVVCEGDVIGSVGEPSNYSVSLGSHLDFKLTKDDVSTDPKVVLAQYEE